MLIGDPAPGNKDRRLLPCLLAHPPRCQALPGNGNKDRRLLPCLSAHPPRSQALPGNGRIEVSACRDARAGSHRSQGPGSRPNGLFQRAHEVETPRVALPAGFVNAKKRGVAGATPPSHTPRFSFHGYFSSSALATTFLTLSTMSCMSSSVPSRTLWVSQSAVLQTSSALGQHTFV